MRQQLEEKIKYSINLIKKSEPLALQYDSKNGIRVAFSGGKDSMVLLDLVKRANVKYHAEMQLTSVDPPELMRFVRAQYPDVRLNPPKISFWELIKKEKTLPTMIMRYCCKYLKEFSGAGQLTMIGIRREESIKRSKRNEVEIRGKKGQLYDLDQFNREREREVGCKLGKETILISPILYWTEKDVWEYIRENKMPYCELYDEGYKRIGCIFCPMSGKKNIYKNAERYPKCYNKMLDTIGWLTKNTIFGKEYINQYPQITNKDLFDAWASSENYKKFFSQKYDEFNLF